MRNYEYLSDEVLRHEDELLDDTRAEKMDAEEAYNLQCMREEMAYEARMAREPLPF